MPIIYKNDESDLALFTPFANSGGEQRQNKGEWDPLTNTPNIETVLITNGQTGDYMTVGVLSAGQNYDYDFGASKGGIISLTLGDEISYNGTIFKKNDTVIPDATEIFFDKDDPNQGTVHDKLSILENAVATKTTLSDVKKEILKHNIL